MKRPPAAELVALYGDTWDTCPWFVIAIGRAVPDGWPDAWDIRARIASTVDDPAALFSWTVAAADPAGSGVLVSTAEAKLSNGDVLELPAVTLRLGARDWRTKPTRWSGHLDLELTRGPTDDPDDRRTVIRSRPFRVIPDPVL